MTLVPSQRTVVHRLLSRKLLLQGADRVRQTPPDGVYGRIVPLAESLTFRSHHRCCCRLFSTASNDARVDATNAAAAAVTAKPGPYVKGPETHFGFESVGVDEKEGRVREVFESVADSYDIMNDLMSGGLHRYWKDRLLDMSAVASMAQAVRRLGEGSAGGSSRQLRILDVAGGTGDIAFRFVEAAGCPERARSSGRDPISVTVCDINPEMLRVGERRAIERYGPSMLRGGTEALSFVEGNAQDLVEFADDSFDLYTIAFGLRNVTDVDRALEEALRVLKPGGRFMCLEFSQVPDPLLRQIYDAYSFHVIPSIGELVANDRPSYQYLVESIRKFSNQEELLARIELAGFRLSRYTNLTGGIVAIHEGWKPT